MKQSGKKTMHRHVSAWIWYACAWLILAWVSGCNQEYSMKLPLAVNADELHLSKQAGSTSILVYAEGDWSVSFKEPVEWASVQTERGSGNGHFLLSYDENEGIGRKAVIVLNKENEQKEIVVLQNGKNPSLNFSNSLVSLPAVALPVRLPLASNLAGEDAKAVRTDILYEDENVGEWLTNATVENNAFEFYAIQNTTGTTRSAQVTLSVTNLNVGSLYGEVITCNVKINQTAENTVILESSKSYIEMDRKQATSITPFSTNIIYSLPFARFSVTPASAQDWLTNIHFTDANLNVDLSENQSGVPREATVRVSLSNQDGEIIHASFTIAQLTISYNYFTFAQLRETITGASGTFGAFSENDVLEGIVISDAGHPNMETNPNRPSAYNDIDLTENEKTAYIQAENGSLGLRIKTTDAMPADSKLKRSNRVVISLHGLTLEKEDNPIRYTLRGVTEAHIIQDAPGSDSNIADKMKKISDLTDEDIYTFVHLQSTEISLPYGSYMNVRANFYARSSWNTNGSDYPALDAVPISIRDDVGGHAHLLTNAHAPWCRYPLPVGSGTLSGIIVHSKLKRFAAADGTLGRYAVRALSQDDIALNAAAKAVTIVEWNAMADGTDVCTAITSSALSNLREGNHVLSMIGTGKMTPSKTLTPSLGAHAVCNLSADYTSAPNSALQFNTAWWNVAENRGEYVVFHFSTAGITGSNLTVNFSQGGGNGTTHYHVPVYWQISYSTDGSVFTDLPDGVYTVRPLMGSSGVGQTLYSVPGLIDHSFTLPDELFNQANVYVRLSAKSNVCAGASLDGGEDGRITSTENNGNTYIRFGVVSFKYHQ